MTIRPVQRMLRNAILGGGAFTGLLLGWSGTSPVFAQPTGVPKSPAAVQPTAPVERNFLNKNLIRLPIEMDQQIRKAIKEIHLYVKDQPSSPWTLKDKVGAAEKSFTFQAPRDGEYWFTMVTVDKQGRSHPADVRTEAPGLAVVIDTQAPQIELINLGSVADMQLIQCEVRDQFLDIGKTRLTFQGGDKVVRDMIAIPGKANVYCVPADAVFTGLVRASADDLAGNQGFVELHISNMKSVKATPRDAAPLPLPGNLGGPPAIQFNDIQKVTNPATKPATKVDYRPDGSQGPRWIENTSSELPQIANPPYQANKSAATSELPKRQIVSTTKVFLDYQIENVGLSGIGKIEVWITRDQGQSWSKIGEDAQRKSPIEVQLPGEGLYGVTLTASNGRGVVAAIPAKGDTPDGWIEVDTSKPTAQITNVRSATENGQAVVHIRWSATDKNLADAPVELFYAATPQGPWLAIAKDLKGEGTHRWAPPVEIGAQAHLRLVATDAAGNVAIASTLEAVLFDDPARPRAVIRNISTTAPATTPTPTQVTPLPVRVVPAMVTPTTPTLPIVQPTPGS
ncbi:MAG: hypothetical protein EXR98_04230 [Gemmataceae bacterium]|nr:hypothetical protein [Gemmataceae bacterium]